jgi:hypothetical protein
MVETFEGQHKRNRMETILSDIIPIFKIYFIDLAQDRDQWRALVYTIMNLRVPENVGKFLCSSTTGSFSRRAQLRK